ncbi:dTMP kinase [Desulfovibrio sp. OttesenSCG-928-A18]|nr:dTMP kinase [Desulfovibrio sp. OttesenSCG-928-A18]
MFISFEGIEGSGKSTALSRLCSLLALSGRAFVRTMEPGGSKLGQSLRALLLDARNSIGPEAELFLYLADRAQHVRQHIRPALEAGSVVLTDRYADSTIVYQGYGRGLDVRELFRLNELAVNGLWPDCTLIFDLPPELGLERARTRNREQGIDVSEGRFEAEALDFHRRIRAGYLDWAARHPERCVLVDAEASPDAVFAQVSAIVLPRLGAVSE